MFLVVRVSIPQTMSRKVEKKKKKKKKRKKRKKGNSM